jgi:hypothetical protein
MQYVLQVIGAIVVLYVVALGIVKAWEFFFPKATPTATIPPPKPTDGDDTTNARRH